MVSVAQFQAWLTTPREREDKRSKRVTIEPSRKENFNGAPYCGGYPDVGVFGYLYDYFAEIGAGKQSNGIYVPLEWGDIAAWVQVSHIDLDRWEATTIMEMSKGFVEYTHKAKNINCTLPKKMLHLILPEDVLAQMV